jgi:hypothetical protein
MAGLAQASLRIATKVAGGPTGLPGSPSNRVRSGSHPLSAAKSIGLCRMHQVPM